MRSFRGHTSIAMSVIISFECEFWSCYVKMNIRDETRHDVHKSAALRYALLCIVKRLISDVHFHITGPKLTFNS